jgi:hypothetical protein
MRYSGHHFEREGFVSLWAGIFPSEEVRVSHLEERYDEEFEDQPLAEWTGEFGFGWFDHDFMDTNFDGLAIRPLRELLAPCSYSESFLERALAEAERQGVRETQFVLLLYDLCYDPNVTGISQGKYLQFLGAFPYTIKHPESLERLRRGE